MNSGRRAVAGSAGLVILAAGLTGGMVLGRATSDLLFYGCAFAQAGVSLAAGRLAAHSGSRVVLAVLITGAVLLRLWFVVQVPTLSGDIYRYIWDGRIVNAGFNPYRHVPSDPALLALRDPRQYGLIDKRDYAVTIYPPVAEGLFAIVTRLSGSVWAMKLAMVLLEGVAVLATARLLVQLGRPVGLIAVTLLHPAPIWEFAGNGHVDAAMMAFLFVAFAWAGGPRRPYPSAMLITMGTLIKPTALLGLPALWRPVQVLLPLCVMVFAALCYLPFIGAGAGVTGFLPNYAHEQGLDTGEGFFWVAALRHLGLHHAPMSVGYGVLAGAILLALALLTTTASFRRRGRHAAAEGEVHELRSALQGTALLLVVFLLLLSPTLPWYVLAALPMTPLLGLWSPFALATGGFLLYGFNTDAPPFFGRWSLMIGIAVLAATFDAIRMRRREKAP